jgi:hypothetical protein
MVVIPAPLRRFGAPYENSTVPALSDLRTTMPSSKHGCKWIEARCREYMICPLLRASDLSALMVAVR